MEATKLIVSQTPARLVLEDESQQYLRLAHPSSALRAMIAYYFEIKSTASPTNPAQLFAIPHLEGLLCFSLNAHSWISLDSVSKQVRFQKGTLLLGALTRPLTTVYPHQNHAFYIKFQPGMLERVAGLLPAELLDSQSTLTGPLQKGALRDRILSATSFEQRVAAAEACLQSRPIPSFSHPFRVVQAALGHFSCYPEQHMETVAGRLAISYRTLHRYFEQELKLSPKYCQKVIRLKKALHQYRSKGSRFDCSSLGYSDFSHFCKEARQLTLRTPAEI